MRRRIELTLQQRQIFMALSDLKNNLIAVAEEDKNIREILLRAFYKCCEQCEIFDSAQMSFLELCEEFIIPNIDNE